MGGSPLVREIEFLFRDLIRSARKRIILEGQYYWSPQINDLLIAKVLEMAGTDFELVLVLADLTRTKSLTRLMAPYETKLLERLETAALKAGVRFIIGTPCVYPKQDSRGRKPKPIYIHSKLLIIDDCYLCVGTPTLHPERFASIPKSALPSKAKPFKSAPIFKKWETTCLHTGTYLDLKLPTILRFAFA